MFPVLRKAALAALLTLPTLTGCATPMLSPLAQVRGAEDDLSAQAARPASAVQVLGSQVVGSEARILYGVVRGGQFLRRTLVVRFSGEPGAPEAWKAESITLNGQPITKGKLGAAERTMLKQELASLLDQVGPEAKRYQVAAVSAATLVNPSRRNAVSFHVDPDAARQALIRSIKEAKRSFFIETFIWHNDAAGQEVVDALAARKAEADRRGEPFDVKILIDAFGLKEGASKDRPDAPIVDALRQKGFEVRLFAPGYVNGGKLLPLTHRKLYIQDGTQFMTGGRNIGDEYLRMQFSSGGNTLQAWHDLLFTVKGEETGRVRDEFFENWARAGGTRPASLAPVVPADGDVAIETVVTDPHDRVRGIREAHQRLITQASNEIVAIYPYFSDDKLVDTLIAAKKKNPGLSLKVLMPGTSEPGREGSIYGILNEQSALQLLAAGAEVRMFDGQPGENRFSHFKGMLVDNAVLSLGSANADARTYKNNHELNTLISDPATIKDFRAQVVNPDWAVARPVKEAELKAVGLKRRVTRKVLEFFDFLL